MSLQEAFRQYFNDKQTITSSEAFAWYKHVKGGIEPGRFAGLYLAVLQPMMKKGQLIRVKRGVYKFTKKGGTVTPTATTDSEWDKYINEKSKVEGGDTDGICKERDRPKVQSRSEESQPERSGRGNGAARKKA
jgi:hypothetical protein